jgi:hypothetical protein
MAGEKAFLSSRHPSRAVSPLKPNEKDNSTAQMHKSAGQITRLSDQDAADAEKALAQWEAWRAEATASGLAFGDFLRQKLQMRVKHVA